MNSQHFAGYKRLFQLFRLLQINMRMLTVLFSFGISPKRKLSDHYTKAILRLLEC